MQKVLALKKSLCLVLALLLVFCTAACGNKKTKKKKKIIIKRIADSSNVDSVGGEEQDNEFTYDWEQDDGDFEVVRPRRELVDATDVTKTVYTPEFTPKTVDWNGPSGYVIVYKDRDKYSKVIAKYLQAFFKKFDGVELKIITDTASPVSKEILVGDTNRYKTSLSETEFSVDLKGKKLVFEGGHRVMVEKAVKWFMSVDRVYGKVTTFKGAASFKSTLSGGYKYVWGEEFDGNFLDKTKFDYCAHMTVHSSSVAADMVDDALIRVNEGKLKMSTAHYFSEFDDKLEVGIPKVICTGDTMQWMYGYAEMRALVPFSRGAWPGWWATNYCFDNSGYFNADKLKYMIEVDFFEVFGSATDLVPNIHKWYRNDGHDPWTYITDKNGEQIKHSGYADMGLEVNRYIMNENETKDYHIYGFKWTPDEMNLSVDGKDYMTFDLNRNYDGLSDMDNFKNSPLHMIFSNFAYFAGGANTNEKNELSIKDLPFDFFVDYVRIYQNGNGGYVTDYGLDKDIEY